MTTAWGGGGNPDVHTPHMDALARGGAVFRNGVSSSPLCVPARHALLTGHLARDARLLDNQPLPEVSSGLPGLAESFRAAGYGTAFIGKLHLDTEFPAPPVRRLGFETWIEAADYDRPFATRYFAPHTRDHVEGGPEVLRYTPGEYAPAGQLRHLLEYVEDRLLDDPERPLFTVLAWSPPHPTLKESGGHHYGDAPLEWHRFYADRTLTTRHNVPVEVTEKLLPHLRGYYAHISAIDEQLGRLAEGLRRLGIARRTIVVYTSDHGDLLGSQGLLEKRLPYLESLLVPLIWSWPGRIPAGTEHHTAMSTLDIGPTLLGLAGVEPPSDLEGADLSGLLLGSEVEAPSSAFITCRLRSRDGGATWRGVHSSGYTYAVPEPGIEPPPGFPMLFDNESDPYQLNNLYGDPVHSDLQAELERESIARQLALGLRPYETH